MMRDPMRNCEFPAYCKGGETGVIMGVGRMDKNWVCKKEKKMCGDGSALDRDAMNYCEFPACPSGEGVIMKYGRQVEQPRLARGLIFSSEMPYNTMDDMS